jgi:hypothetical protein
MSNGTIDERLICLACIGDAELHSSITNQAIEVDCSYCKERGEGMRIATLAELIAEPLRATLRWGDVGPHFSAESDSPFYEQDGEDLQTILQEELGVDYSAAQHIADALVDQDPADIKDGEDPFFQSDQLYERDEVSDGHYADTWHAFATSVTYRRRFFDAAAQAQLAEILGAPDSGESAELPITLVREGMSIDRVYRARRARSEQEVGQFLQLASSALGPPPPTVASAGRMNPAGISVFYSAVSKSVSIAEVRPSVGGYVAIATFQPTRTLSLLDLTRLRSKANESIFTPGYVKRAARKRFLQSFHSIITRPVQPHDEVLEYLPTQAVAEYVRNVLKFDGVLFASTQTGRQDEKPGDQRGTDPNVAPHANCNVVIFAEDDTPIALHEFGVRQPSVPRLSFPLVYVDKSAQAVVVLQVAYEYEDAYLGDPTLFDTVGVDLPAF